MLTLRYHSLTLFLLFTKKKCLLVYSSLRSSYHQFCFLNYNSVYSKKISFFGLVFLRFQKSMTLIPDLFIFFVPSKHHKLLEKAKLAYLSVSQDVIRLLLIVEYLIQKRNVSHQILLQNTITFLKHFIHFDSGGR